MKSNCEECEHWVRNELKLILQNPLGVLQHFMDCTDQSREPFIIKKGDRIAQVMLLEHKSSLFNIESDVERTGGFGSSGSR